MMIIRQFLLQIFPLLFFGAAILYPQENEKITAFFSGENERYSLSSIQKDGVCYISIEEISDLLGLSLYSNSLNKKTILRSENKTLKVTSFNSFLLLNDELLQMALPTLEVRNKIYVPLILFIETTQSFFHARLVFDSEKALLRISKILENITGVEISKMGNGTIVKFAISKSFKPAEVAASISRRWLNVTFLGGVLDSAYLASSGVSGKNHEIVPYQFNGSAQVSVKLDQDMADKRIDIGANSVLVSLWHSSRQNNTNVESSIFIREKWRIDRIVVDPGHGGKHPGAIGGSGLKEKQVTLDVALRLKSLLNKRLPGVEVLLTRENDMFMGLKERTQFANANGGKLFISIHADANINRSIRGFSTYFLGIAKTPEALEVAQKENSVIEMEESSEQYQEFQDAAYILNAIAQSSYLKESQDLAQMVNQSLRISTKIPDQGIHQAGFYVLIGASMPSVLVETGFLSNAYEERMLKTRSFLQKIAEGLCDSICRFKSRYEKEIG